MEGPEELRPTEQREDLHTVSVRLVILDVSECPLDVGDKVVFAPVWV
jgi:hypothetical protein